MALKQSRAFDALFDNTYTVSGARDHYKQQGRAGFVLQQVPEHANFFSDLKHYPKSTFRVKASAQLPASVDRNFHPHQHIPQLLKWQSSPQQINGPQLFKFFRRPLLPAGASLTLHLRLAPQQQAPRPPPPEPEPKTKDAGTQSLYRESEAQTLPWSPDWVQPTNAAVLAKQAALCAKYNIAGPEVLQLAHLTFGNGLPCGLQEVRRLEKLRAKRAFEATLPPIDDVERLPERQVMIEAWEVQEWIEREEEIRGVQEERLALLAQALQVREEEIEAAHREQVQKRSATLLASKANKFATIHTERLKTYRQLAAAKDKVTGTLDRRSKSKIVQQYADYGSELYAPPQRDGHFPDVIPAGAATAGQLSHTRGGSSSPTKQLHPSQFAPNSIAALSELEASLPRKALKPAGTQKLAASGQSQKLTYKQRAEAAVHKDVETIHDMLEAAKASTGTRGIGKVWPCPLDDGPASAAALAAAAAAAAADGQGASRHGLRSQGKSGIGSLAAAAAAAATVAPGGARPTYSARSAAARAGAANATSSQAATEAPPLPDPDGTHAALVLLQRLLRGRAVQNQMYAGKESRLQLIRELRLGLEGIGGGQQRPEVRDAATQERDAAAGAALCRLCCLLASDDQAAIAQVLADVAERRAQQQGQLQQPGLKQQQEQQELEQQPDAEQQQELPELAQAAEAEAGQAGDSVLQQAEPAPDDSAAAAADGADAAADNASSQEEQLEEVQQQQHQQEQPGEQLQEQPADEGPAFDSTPEPAAADGVEAKTSSAGTAGADGGSDKGAACSAADAEEQVTDTAAAAAGNDADAASDGDLKVAAVADDAQVADAAEADAGDGEPAAQPAVGVKEAC